VRPFVGALVCCASLLAACGGDGAGGSSGVFDDVPADRELVGYVSDPAPSVGDVTLPDLTDGDAAFALRAQPGDLLLVYFGYTNCPDFCPTTMSDVKLASQRISDPDRVEVAMVTVDPSRDLAILSDYVTSFVAGGHALGTSDDTALERAAAPLGVTYEVRTAADGSTQVGHTTALYGLDDTGTLVVTWPFGVTIDDLATDLAQLLNEQSA
jgi:protein SCO1/2